MMMKTYKTQRGFHGFNKWKSVWYGEMRVQESSAAFKGACVWVFTETSNPDRTVKGKNPTLHLSFIDAKNLRDGISKILRFSKESKAGFDQDGFRGVNKWKSVWHGQLRIREVHVDMKAPVWISADLSYSNAPKENPPHFSLSRADAKNVRDGLSEFVRQARADKLVEPARKTQPKAGY